MGKKSDVAIAVVDIYVRTGKPHAHPHPKPHSVSSQTFYHFVEQPTCEVIKARELENYGNST